MPRYRFAADIPEDLGREVRRMIDAVRDDPHPSGHARHGVELILRLTQVNLDYYFVESARRLGLGMVALSSIRLGLRTALGGISMFVKGLAGALSDEQVRRLAERMDEMLIVEEEGGGPSAR